MDESYKTITINDISMDIYENLSLGVAGEIWKCGLGFSSFISSEKSKKYFKNKIVLEVGSGTGVCGLFAASIESKKVYLTDREMNLGLLKKNLEMNKEVVGKCEVIITTLDWNYTHEFKNLKEKFDIIIASEIIYHGLNYSNQVKLLDHFTDKNTEILLGYYHRLASGYEFFNILENQEKWEIKKLPTEMIDIEYRINNFSIFLIKKIK